MSHNRGKWWGGINWRENKTSPQGLYMASNEAKIHGMWLKDFLRCYTHGVFPSFLIYDFLATIWCWIYLHRCGALLLWNLGLRGSPVRMCLCAVNSPPNSCDHSSAEGSICPSEGEWKMQPWGRGDQRQTAWTCRKVPRRQDSWFYPRLRWMW